MKRIFLSLTLCMLTLIGFAQSTEVVEGQAFGAAVTKSDIIPASSVKATLGKKNKADMKVMGEVVSVCKKKGCFMNVKLSDKETMFVNFKDYAFFMPKDMPAGTKVVIDGFAQKKETSVEDLQHYARDAKKSDEEIAKIKKPKKEIVFEAKGVVIMK